MMNYDLFRKRLDECRRKKGFTQQELADLCNVSPKTIQVITSGKRKPSISLFAKLCIHLERPAEYFLNEERKNFMLSDESIQALKAMPESKLKHLLAIIRILYDEQN